MDYSHFLVILASRYNTTVVAEYLVGEIGSDKRMVYLHVCVPHLLPKSTRASFFSFFSNYNCTRLQVFTILISLACRLSSKVELFVYWPT